MLDKAGLVLGIAFIFSAPGYAWSYVMPGGHKLGMWARVASAVGLSVGLVPLGMFWLDWLIGIPVNLLDAFLVALALSITPLGYKWLKRRGFITWLGSAPPGALG